MLLKLFIAEQAFTAVQNQYDTLDTLYVGDTPETTAEGNIFETTYVIVDDSFDIKYISASMYDLSEKKFLKRLLIIFQIMMILNGLMILMRMMQTIVITKIV